MINLASLNEQQREAVVSDSKRMLVLAGAGSGKTKTLIQKVLHLISYKHVRPSNILAITFTKNAANEMIDRLIASDAQNRDYSTFIESKEYTRQQKEQERQRCKSSVPWINKLTVRTFHSLCFTILKNSLSPEVFDNAFRIIIDDISEEDSALTHANVAPESSKAIMDKVLLELCSDMSYLLKLKRYILDYMGERKSVDTKLTPTYINANVYVTLKGDKVKSKSERDIADWLYRHRIEYEYEKELFVKDFRFKPDFYLPQAKIYIEHISDKSYPMKGKEEQLKLAGILCEQTHEDIMHDTDLFNKEMERIIRGKIDLNINSRIALNFEEEFKGQLHKIKDFVLSVIRIRSLIRLEGLTEEEAKHKSSKNQHERIRLFYELAIPLISAFNGYCTNKSYLDFDDLITKTIQLFEQRPEIRDQYRDLYKFILVDEFQDVNTQQVRLLKLLLNDDTQLFCVGDDWQSIYGFRGSEVKYIVNFEEHFDHPEIIKLNVNYRSNQSIVNASNEVIKYNKHQVRKEVVAYKKTPSRIQIYRAVRSDVDGVAYLLNRVNKLQEEGIAPEEILILYRRSMMYLPYKNALRNAGLQATARTIHAAKGLEAKAVFILGLTDGQGGFPEVWATDALSKIIKEVKHDHLLEEERRLFYVALTRAKEELHLITEIGSESPFIDEIPKELLSLKSAELEPVIEAIPLCEYCGTERKTTYRFCPTCGQSLMK